MKFTLEGCMSKIIKLYHGSENIIEKPLFGKGKPYNDYGLGFYCTKDKDLACEWAVSEDKSGYANEYEIDLTGLKILNLNKVQYPILTWLTVLIQNRTFDSYTQVQSSAKNYLIKSYNINYQDYDIIIGYRADDSYFQFAKAFLNSAISYKTLTNSMLLGELGNQYVIKSQEAFSRINFLQSTEATADIWYQKKIEREEKAKGLYANSKLEQIKNNDILLGDIIRGRLNDNDKEILRQGISSISSRSSRSDD